MNMIFFRFESILNLACGAQSERRGKLQGATFNMRNAMPENRLEPFWHMNY